MQDEHCMLRCQTSKRNEKLRDSLTVVINNSQNIMDVFRDRQSIICSDEDTKVLSSESVSHSQPVMRCAAVCGPVPLHCDREKQATTSMIT